MRALADIHRAGSLQRIQGDQASFSIRPQARVWAARSVCRSNASYSIGRALAGARPVTRAIGAANSGGCRDEDCISMAGEHLPAARGLQLPKGCKPTGKPRPWL
jgi:hypothetical protein